jgi:hypothetical protein
VLAPDGDAAVTHCDEQNPCPEGQRCNSRNFCAPKTSSSSEPDHI